MQNYDWQVADTIEYELLKEKARVLRKNMTEAESVFWNLAKRNGFGEKCRRQYIIGGYIVDFYFRKSNLVVELDGGYHFTGEQQKEDTIRQEWLEKKGYRILRFKNEEILFDTEKTLCVIKQNLIASL